MKKKGLTLIELIVVLATICLLVAIIGFVICIIKFDYRYKVKDHDGTTYYTDNIEYDGNRLVFVDEHGHSHMLTAYSVEEIR